MPVTVPDELPDSRFLPSCSWVPHPRGPLDAAFNSISTDGILQHIKVLASDEYEGRGPGTRGRGEDRRLPDRAASEGWG